VSLLRNQYVAKEDASPIARNRPSAGASRIARHRKAVSAQSRSFDGAFWSGVSPERATGIVSFIAPFRVGLRLSWLTSTSRQKDMIRFRYQPTFKDYVALNRFVMWRQLRYLIIIAGLLVVLFALLPVTLGSLGSSRSTWEIYRSSLTVLILPGIVMFLLISTYFAVRKRWNAAEELRIDREYEIDDFQTGRR
jgi:hypothetical protein